MWANNNEWIVLDFAVWSIFEDCTYFTILFNKGKNQNFAGEKLHKEIRECGKKTLVIIKVKLLFVSVECESIKSTG
jgi:hypothetical protein